MVAESGSPSEDGRSFVYQVLHLGGNGHAAVRLERVRAALASQGDAVSLIDVPYPGFEGRTPSSGLEDFLTRVGDFCRSHEGPHGAAIAVGIGGLIALTLRARGALRIPLILQAPVLWGLEHRLFPRVMRYRSARRLLPFLFSQPWFQLRFVRRHFRSPLDSSTRLRFFEGYERCSAFVDLFDWFTPALLRDLEKRFADHPDRLHSIRVWQGGLDTVVSPSELTWTERALGVRWPVDTFATWGHYPIIETPGEWAVALRDALAHP